ncbi:MAG: histidine phosphatase family protein [Beutenbergiaceae bacterium]
MTATVVLLRHGRTPWNVAARLQGQADVDLDDVGKRQASEVAQALATLEPAAIISSDLRRAIDTAAAVAAACGGQVRPDQRLRERAFGQWEGLTRAEIKAGWPQEFPLWERGGLPAGIGMESRAATGTRVAAAINEQAGELEPEQVLIAVTHGAAIGAGITTLLGQDPDTWRGIPGVANCHWSELQPNSGGAPAWRLFRHDIGV